VSSVTSAQPTTAPPLGLVLTSLFRADFLVLLKNRRAVLFSILLPVLVLISTNSGTATRRLGGPAFVIGLAIAYGLVSTSIMGYTVTVARDREKGVFQRLRVTPAPTWTIMASPPGHAIGRQSDHRARRRDHRNSSAPHLAVRRSVRTRPSRLHPLRCGVSQRRPALVGLVKSADTVSAAARVLYIALILLGTLGLAGTLGSVLESTARWTPVGTVMTLFAGVLNLSAWSAHDTLSLVVSVAYIVVFAGIGIRWFQWDAR